MEFVSFRPNWRKLAPILGVLAIVALLPAARDAFWAFAAALPFIGAVADFDGQYWGLGIKQVVVDSGLVVKSATPATVALTVATVGGTQPTVQRGKYVAMFSALNGSAVLGTLEVTAGDGSNTEYLDWKGVNNSQTAGQGATLIGELFSAFVNITNIVTVTIRMNTTGNNNYSMQGRFLGGM